ncbi:MAG: fused response regulator/phosphatase [Gammaproteobacteria bacterium]|nr:MAG: fused response regulator/phosphatase [Gammaproteobacteria bacterium]
MKILIADDNNIDRLILKKILVKSGHEVTTAVDGFEAVELFEQSEPDIVLLDALMPNMDGFQACEIIKQKSGDKLIPIIFVTSLTEASALARCLEVGGDDFLTKPYNQVILKAKLKAFERMKVLYDEVLDQRNEIRLYTDHLVQEQEVAKRVFDNIAHSGNLEQTNIQHILSPMSVFNGDLLLCAITPTGNTHIMLGDFTGHGLPAAIAVMPVADIFYGMTIKGFSIADIIAEINNRLNRILPIGVFCCATACDINYRDKSITFWSGGLPDGYIIRPNVGLVQTVISNHLPLGVLNSNSFLLDSKVFRFEEGDKLYLFSDGILEAEDPSGDMFGDQRVLELLQSKTDDNNVFEKLLEEVSSFCETDVQNDDLTLIEYTFSQSALGERSLEHSGLKDKIRPLDWSIQYELRPETLRSFDALPLVLQILTECPGLNPYRGRVFTILAELYSNALDHGVLGLDSLMKSSAEGFSDYYKLRKLKLDKLQTGYVQIKMEHIPSDIGGDLIIDVMDSGKGFDCTTDNYSGNDFSGRGIELIRSLCKSVEYYEGGSHVKVIFQWQY